MLHARPILAGVIVHELLALLTRAGWRLARIRGTQHYFRHPLKGGVVIIPAAENDVLSSRAVRSVLRASEVPTGTGDGETARFLVVIEPTASGFSAYVPDIVGCVSTGRSVEEVEVAMREAIAGHLEEIRGSGLGIPIPRALVRSIEVIA